MPIHHLQPSFAGGEISPSLHGRVDSAAYGSWLKNAQNFYVHPQGGASNRPGTLYMGTAKLPAQACRVIPFVLGEDEAYVLELGEMYILPAAVCVRHKGSHMKYRRLMPPMIYGTSIIPSTSKRSFWPIPNIRPNS